MARPQRNSRAAGDQHRKRLGKARFPRPHLFKVGCDGDPRILSRARKKFWISAGFVRQRRRYGPAWAGSTRRGLPRLRRGLQQHLPRRVFGSSALVRGGMPVGHEIVVLAPSLGRNSRGAAKELGRPVVAERPSALALAEVVQPHALSRSRLRSQSDRRRRVRARCRSRRSGLSVYDGLRGSDRFLALRAASSGRFRKKPEPAHLAGNHPLRHHQPYWGW